ncbi:MAG: riboflavin kinase [Candidatus Peribacteraceae bacterium]|nr:riboflavin kinase [Candidatus Peribacteraceae bacterium]
MTPFSDFAATVVTGAGRGRRIGTPTLNLDLGSVPTELEDGVYACRARLDGDGNPLPAVMHLGPRPVFHDSRSCEVHLLDDVPPETTASVAVSDLAYLRPVQNFPSKDALVEQIGRDVAAARAILGA